MMMNTWFVFACLAVLVLTTTVFGLVMWRRARAWALFFGHLSNAERILLMWPTTPQGLPLKRLDFSMDQNRENGFMRVASGSMLLAKFPIDEALAGQKGLQKLIDSAGGKW